jgi:hypothetical protein
LFVHTVPAASSTASETKFSDAISSMLVAWRRASRRTQSAISGSACSSARSEPAPDDSRSIISTRRWCRPPSNGVASQVVTSGQARSTSSRSAGSASMFASLCSRAMRAASTSWTHAARTPGKRLAV